MRRHVTLAVALSGALILAGCGGGGTDGGSSTTANVPPPVTVASPVPPAPAGANFNVTDCLTQQVSAGVTVASIVVPDELSVDFQKPSTFPNGRQLTDPVIDIILASIFLDLKKHPVTTFVNIPLNPAANDLPFRPGFPYLAAPQGSPPLSPTNGTNFNFRTDPVSAFVRVDRMGVPAVATALIGSAAKTRYNDASPIDDDQLKFYDEIHDDLTGLINALSDDFAQRGLSTCATKG